MLSGAAVVGLGAGPFVGLAAAAPSAVDYNCPDFRYQEDAQAKLLPGDPYRLDADHDGVACQNLPHRGSSATTATPVTSGTKAAGTASRTTTGTATRAASSGSSASASRSAITDLDCGDFTSQAQAQRVLDRDHGDPNRLDADHDGTACESQHYASGSTASPMKAVSKHADTAAATDTPAVTDTAASTDAVVPVGGVAAGDGSTGGGSDALWYGLLTTAAVAGAAGAHQFVGGRHRRRA